MATLELEELLALDMQARLALVEELWDSIIKDAQASAELPLSISDAERHELDDRLREDDDHPEQAIGGPKLALVFVTGIDSTRSGLRPRADRTAGCDDRYRELGFLGFDFRLRGEVGFLGGGVAARC